jgi:tetratricopeptide (TPR) repeat protein
MACYWGAPNSGKLLDAACAEAEAARNQSPEMAWGWLASGVAGFLRTGDADTACEQLTRAFDSDPAIVLISIWRSLVLCAKSDFGAAVAEAARATDLDPHGEGPALNLVQILFFARLYWRCAGAAAHALMKFDSSLGLRAYRGLALLFAGDEAAGIDVMLSSWRAGAGRSERLAALSRAFEEGGVSAYFKELAIVTSSEHLGDIVRPIDRTILWALAGEKARALEALDLAVARNDPRLRWISVMPQLDSLRGMPEFEAIRTAHAPFGG